MATTRRRRSEPGSQRLRALTYGRVSTGRQATSGLSLDDQADTLAACVAERGWVHVAHVSDPGLSGRTLSKRRGLISALERLDAGEADVLVAAKLDRLSRSTTDFAQLLDRAERGGWKVVVLDVAGCDTTTAAGRLVAEVVSAAAAFESRRIGERVAAAHARRRMEGKRPGPAPLLDPALRERIARERAAGSTLGAIAARLNVEGVPTARGGVWHPSTVAHVARSVALDAELCQLSGGPSPAGR